MLKGLILILSTDKGSPEFLLKLAAQSIQGGIDSLQLRHKGMYTPELFSLGQELVNVCRRAAIPLIVNDRIDIALALEASGVHLGQTDVPVPIARKLLGKDKIIGGTASNLEEALHLEKQDVDYIGIGHIFPTTSKLKHGPPLGVKSLGQIVQRVNAPLIAIGGINAENLELVYAAGVQGAAVISSITDSEDPCFQTKQLKKMMR